MASINHVLWASKTTTLRSTAIEKAMKVIALCGVWKKASYEQTFQIERGKRLKVQGIILEDGRQMYEFNTPPLDV